MSEENNAGNDGGNITMIARNMVADIFSNYNAGGQPQAVEPVAPPPPAPVAPVAPPVEMPPVTPSVEPPSSVEDPTTPGAQDKQNFAWAQLRHEIKEANNKLAEAQKSIDAERLRAEELNTKLLEQENKLAERERTMADLEDRLGRTNLAESSEFRARFTEPMSRIEDELTSLIIDKTTLKDEKAARKEAKQLLSARDSDVAESIRALPPYVQGAIYNYVRDSRALDAERDAALAAWRDTADGWVEEETRRVAEASAARRAEQADAAAQAFALRTADIPTMAITNSEFATRRDEELRKAVAFLRTAKDEDISKAAVEGLMAPLAYEIIGALSQQVQDLQNQIQAARGLTSPPVRPTSYGYPPSVQTPPPPPQQIRPTSHDIAMDAARSFLSSAPQHLR